MRRAENKKSSTRLLFALAVMKILLISGMIYIYKSGTYIASVHAPLIEAAVKTKLEATRAHLLFEEIISGDATESIDEVWRHLDQAEWYARAITHGGSKGDDNYIPIHDRQLDANVADALKHLAQFRHIAEMRLAARKTSPAGSPIDQRFDAVFADMMQTMHQVTNSLKHAMTKELAFFQQIQITIIIFGILFAIIVIIVTHRFILRINDDVHQLHDAHEELEHSNRDLASFAYIASHDLREPLRKIQAFGDRLTGKESENLSERGKDYIVRMQKAAARMKDLIEALLNYSRIDSKGATFAPTDLNAVLHEVLDDLEHRIEEVGGAVHANELPQIDADAVQIRQVFQNLIANALKFQREGVAPEIQVHAKINKGICTLTFADNGIGFEPEYAERIFGVFQRLHGRDAYEGTGIGLSICQKTAERHHGSISAQGRPGEGATFTLLLPVRQEKEA